MSAARPPEPVLLARDLGGLLLYGPGQALVSAMPRPWLRPLASLGSALKARLLAEEQEAREELRLLFGAQPRPRLEAQILLEARQIATYNDLEMLRYPHMSPQTIDEYCTIEGMEHIDAARAKGKGAIVLIGHFGANQMIMPALGHRGLPMSQLSAPPPVWAEILKETRTTALWPRVLERRWELEQRLPVRHINVFRFLRPAFDCLRNNELLGLAFDGGGGKTWVQVQLMARRAWLSAQPAQLWKKSGATLLPTVVLRPPGELRHRIVVGAGLQYESRAGPAESELTHNVQRYVSRFSAHVASWPEHYLPYLLLRRRVRGTDIRPFFDDYPPSAQQLSAEGATSRLESAAQRLQR